MSTFRLFKEAVQEQYDNMLGSDLFVTDTDLDEIWDTYLNAFPVGSNPIFRERTEHDCSCCKQFIRATGNVVAIKNNKLVTIWDKAARSKTLPEHYVAVAKALATYVKSKPIANLFLHYQQNLGTDHNHEPGDPVIRWEHFHYKLPKEYVKNKNLIGTVLSQTLSGKQVCKRGLSEITTDAIDTVIELIEQNSIYRGDEHLGKVRTLASHKEKFDKLKTEAAKDNYAWLNNHMRVRNSAIGTLLVDLSDGVDLTKAVKKFEAKVAPENYKRPTALITKRMISNAQAKVEELGIKSALERRYAVTTDITVNNVLYADRTARQEMDVFDALIEATPTDKQTFDKVENVPIDVFIKDILPKAESIEVFVDNKHENKFMSLIAPVDPTAKNILKWDNNFSWSYNGEVTDSMKQRVSKAGGSVTGHLRCSLGWFNSDDLDIHVVEPDGNEIYFGNSKSHQSLGELDVDMNAGSSTINSVDPVENITWPLKDKIPHGRYKVFVRQFTKRGTSNPGFDAEIEIGGEIRQFHYAKALRQGETVVVGTFTYKGGDKIKMISSLPSVTASKEIWGVITNTPTKVKMIMHSPNHWDGKKQGNKHWFFILDNCNNPEESRGFYNEFLNDKLHDHRKVFEVLGSKMKVAKSDNQLSGLGFSSTQADSLKCKVSGSFNRIINIVF